jgi:hypothetical protein
MAALTVLAPLAGCQAKDKPSIDQPSLSITLNSTGDPARAWVASQGVPARPAWSDDWSEWVVKAGATPLSALTVLLTVDGKVSAVRVKVLARRPAVAGTQYVVVGTDPVASEPLEFDLDGPLEARAVTPETGGGDTIAVTVQTQQCDCDWVVELDWSGGTRTVDNNGKPFRVSASTATTGRCVTYPDRVEKCETF